MCGNEETQNHDSKIPNTSLLLRVCAACPTPRVNLSFELRPSWNNIHDTFPTGITQDTTLHQALRAFLSTSAIPIPLKSSAFVSVR